MVVFVIILKGMNGHVNTLSLHFIFILKSVVKIYYPDVLWYRYECGEKNDQVY